MSNELEQLANKLDNAVNGIMKSTLALNKLAEAQPWGSDEQAHVYQAKREVQQAASAIWAISAQLKIHAIGD